MLANNETGVLQPVEEIGRIARETGAFFHIDAVQGAGKVRFDVRRFGCHLLSISAHKMHGPKGVGAMFVRRGTPVESLLVGGSHERRRRAGTENVAGIVGLAKAAELAMQSLEDGTIERVAALRDCLEAEGSCIRMRRVQARTASRWLAPPTLRTSGLTTLKVRHSVIALDLKGVAVSGGFLACHSGATEPSHVLLAMDGQEPCASQPALQPAEDGNRGRRGPCFAVVPEAVKHLRALAG